MIKAVDLETSIYNKGNFADTRNYVCFAGVGDTIWDIEYYKDEPYGHKLVEIQQAIDEATLLVFCNAKFDIHHLKNLGITCSHKRIWDCSLVEYMLSGQTMTYPSMNQMADIYSLEQKPDIKTKYWEEGIQTCDIPYDEIADYLQHHDLPTTLAIYNHQKARCEMQSVQFQRLVSVHNQDTHCLAEMEHNGLFFDEKQCIMSSTELEIEIKKLQQELTDYHDVPEFNTASGDHMSALIYGGVITIPRKVLVGVYKTGDRVGQDKYGWQDFVFNLPTQFKPLAKTELKKAGFWQTGADILKQLKCRDNAGKHLIKIILSLAKLEKLLGTYYKGLPALREKMNWKGDYLYGNLSQVSVVTGRLSSSKPNLQNISGEMKNIFRSRYGY